MADLTVNEKYPGSFRLDHPDFGDVRKTTYATGVITEFKKLTDDPLAVDSMVKVNLGGDFLPIFFCPKKQYWDSLDDLGNLIVDSQSLDQVQKAYKKAWMSFRIDDEVVVMLRENEPFAVMGFNDSKPKIGEGVLKYESKTWGPYYAGIPFSSAQINNSDNGPDGLSLGLKENGIQSDGSPQCGVLAKDFFVWNDSVSIWTGTVIDPVTGLTLNERIHLFDTAQFLELFYIVGPFIYVYQVYGVGSDAYVDIKYSYASDPDNYFGEIDGHPRDYVNWNIVFIRQYAAIYNEVIYNQVKSIRGSAQSAYGNLGVTYQTGGLGPDGLGPPDFLIWGSPLPPGFIKQVSPALTPPTGPIQDAIKLYVRPHN